MTTVRDEILRKIRARRADWAAAGVRTLLLFGSLVRTEAHSAGDVHLLVEFDRPVGLFELFRLQDRLEEVLGRNVDLVVLRALKPRFRDRALREAVRVA
jgi:hypothetical protein